MAIGEVVLADGSVDSEGVVRDVGGERSVGAVDVVVRADVLDRGQVNGGMTSGMSRPIDRMVPTVGTKIVA